MLYFASFVGFILGFAVGAVVATVYMLRDVRVYNET
jgi:hypothetical protein